MSAVSSKIIVESPFVLRDEEAYRRWRETKLDGYPRRVEDLVVEVKDMSAPSTAEMNELRRLCKKTNMAVYANRTKHADGKLSVGVFAARFDLTHLDHNMLSDEDGITSLQAVPGQWHRGYIPYSNERILWHTDGYYNAPERTIRAMVLHCATPAAEGGENALLDHEMAYVHLRDTDPAYIHALMSPDVMTIPANTEPGSEVRAAYTGPVFSVDARGDLHMRYTERARNIVWKQDETTQAALRCLRQLLGSDSPYVFRHRLSAEQGVLCNNVLHNRTAFVDNADSGRTRLLYRARYHDRIAGTGVYGA